MNETKLPAMNAQNAGQEPIPPYFKKLQEGILKNTRMEGERPSDATVARLAKISPESENSLRGTTFIGSAQSSVPEELTSMNLIDRSAECMFGMMEVLEKDIRQNRDGHEKRLIDAACNCAKQIEKLMRLKLDVLKLKAGK